MSNILLQNFYQHKFFCRRYFPIVSMGDEVYIFHGGKFCLQAQKLADCNPLFYLNFLHNDRGRWKIIFIFAFFQFNKTVVSHDAAMIHSFNHKIYINGTRNNIIIRNEWEKDLIHYNLAHNIFRYLTYLNPNISATYRSMIAIKEKKMLALASSLLVVLVLFIGSSSAFVQSHSSFNVNNRSSSTSTSSSTSIGIGAFFNEGKKKLVKSLAGEYDATAIQDRMNGLIDAEPVLMFSFTTCPFCIKAKGVLDGMNAKYTVIELDTDPDGKAIRAEMADIVGQTSVPAIWIGGEFAGG